MGCKWNYKACSNENGLGIVLVKSVEAVEDSPHGH
jgi:hypothetical protein